jgi:hypothetical protein
MNALGFQIMEGKLFTLNLHQLPLKKTTLIIIKQEVIIKN